MFRRLATMLRLFLPALAANVAIAEAPDASRDEFLHSVRTAIESDDLSALADRMQFPAPAYLGPGEPVFVNRKVFMRIGQSLINPGLRLLAAEGSDDELAAALGTKQQGTQWVITTLLYPKPSSADRGLSDAYIASKAALMHFLKQVKVWVKNNCATCLADVALLPSTAYRCGETITITTRDAFVANYHYLMSPRKRELLASTNKLRDLTKLPEFEGVSIGHLREIFITERNGRFLLQLTSFYEKQGGSQASPCIDNSQTQPPRAGLRPGASPLRGAAGH